MQIIFNFVIAFLSTIAFGIIFYVPPKVLPFAALTGACGYISYYIISSALGGSDILACAAGGVIIAFMAEFFAIIQKNPVTAYEMPAVMPLVPGIGLYRTMLSFLDGNSLKAMNNLFQTVLCAGSIAIGLILTEAFTQFRRQRHKKAK